jgi:hypothetical protein
MKTLCVKHKNARGCAKVSISLLGGEKRFKKCDILAIYE